MGRLQLSFAVKITQLIIGRGQDKKLFNTKGKHCVKKLLKLQPHYKKLS
ncbi:MAG: hypothetical protein ACK4NF_06485 [Planctomycetota bacterium]